MRPLRTHRWSILQILLLVVTCTLHGQTTWTKHPQNPVLSAGPTGAWDDGGVIFGWVLKEGSQYKMWFSGYSNIVNQIGYATSSDGIVWTKHFNNPVLPPGTSGSWDGGSVFAPIVVRIGTMYHMWYSGSNTAPYFQGTLRVGHATSPDGIVWTKDVASNPVLDVGAPGSWDESWVYSGSIVTTNDSTLTMWYSGLGTSGLRIGLASSTNTGSSWTKTAQPVMMPTESWESTSVQNPSVMFDSTQLHMWYNGGDGTLGFRIGYATSNDGGITWIRSTIPVLDLGAPGSWESDWVWAPHCITDGMQRKMWYTGYNNSVWRIGYATSSTTDVRNINSVLPARFSLEQNFPNPFNPTTNIKFQTTNSSNVSLKVFDVLGREVATLVNEELKAGSYEVTFDAAGIASGMYWYRLLAGNSSETRKMILTR